MTKEHDKIWTKDKDESELEGGGEVISEPEDPTVKCQLSRVLPNSNENARSLLLHYNANMV